MQENLFVSRINELENKSHLEPKKKLEKKLIGEIKHNVEKLYEEMVKLKIMEDVCKMKEKCKNRNKIIKKNKK